MQIKGTVRVLQENVEDAQYTPMYAILCSGLACSWLYQVSSGHGQDVAVCTNRPTSPALSHHLWCSSMDDGQQQEPYAGYPF
ncbi:hypothetical protein ACLKA6_011926 [Drosophila palustris]